MEKIRKNIRKGKEMRLKIKKMPLILFFANQEKARRLGRWK